MYAQRQNRSASRPHNAGRRFTPAPIRARIGLLMRRGSTFGEIVDAERAVRAGGLGLAPLTAGDEPFSEGGITILATATTADLDSGNLRALVVPEGTEIAAGLKDVVTRAMAAGLPVMAFGTSVAEVASAADVATIDAPAAVVTRDGAVAIADAKQLTTVAEAIA